MKIALLLLSLLPQMALSSSVNKILSESNLYANIYADELIRKFDKTLDNPLMYKSLFQNPVYAKIQAARMYIEGPLHKKGNIQSYGEKSFLSVTNVNEFNNTKKTIDMFADLLLEQQFQSSKSNNSFQSSDVIYPSATHDGNLTGNTYPTNVWSLTFDDGPKSQSTDTVVDNLYRYGIKASFFMLTRNAKANPVSVNKVMDADMEIALHSYTHENLSMADQKTVDFEIGTAKLDLENLTGRGINIFRLPYGAGMRKMDLRKTIASLGLVHIFWNVDTLDWKDKDPKSIVARTLKQMSNTPKQSGIILFHDIHDQTVIASEMIMKHLTSNSMKVCTVGEVINHINGNEQDCL